MRNVTPTVRLIARTFPRREEISEWLHEHEVSGAQIEKLFEGRSWSTILIEMAGRRCYKSFEPGLNPNVTKIREDVQEYIRNILKVGHGSVLEHVSFTFAIENVSRVFTGEMNRHRAGMAISEGSMRYIRFEDIPYWIPDSIYLSDTEKSHLLANDPSTDTIKKAQSQEVFRDVFSYVEKAYQRLQDIWKEELAPSSTFRDKKNITSMMRRIIPMGVATGGLWTGNVRALRHIFNMRCDEAAEEEIQLVAELMLEILLDIEPILFGDFKRNEKGYYHPEFPKV